MESALDEKTTYRDYTELWNFNLGKIERIQRHIESSINDLEMKYVEFEPVYDDIMEQIDILSSIYSSYNSIEGAESVLRLKSVLESFRKKYTREGLDFNLVQHLIVKINEARNRSFSDFPKLDHDDRPATIPAGEAPCLDYSIKRHRWITFERNRSWFITPFTSIEIRTDPELPIESYEDPDYLIVSSGGTALKIRDIFGRRGRPDRPIRYVLLDGANRNFAATAIGKQIYAERDIVTPFLRPFKTVESNRLSPGRIRLFGRNHILLYR